MIRSFLIHLSMNMWEDCYPEHFKTATGEEYRARMPEHWQRMPGYMNDRAWRDHLQFDQGMWETFLTHFARSGGNTVVLDVGDGVAFRSHPEIAVPGAWTPLKLKGEIARCRDLGLTLIPKLNFSSCHDAWMRQYSRMLATPEYYRVCRDLIAECAELFDSPAHFHLGMDEEGFECQRDYEYITIRRGRLWWDDLNFYFDEVRKAGARPWMWSDKLWHCDVAEFAANVPRDVVQNNWYYWSEFDIPAAGDDAEMQRRRTILDTFGKLDRLGYDQVPAGSTWGTPYNVEGLVPFCRRHIAPERLLGFMTAPWCTTEEKNGEALLESCDQLERACRE